MKTYRVDLENVTDKNIEIISSFSYKSHKQARSKAIKLSNSKEFEKAKDYPNRGGAGFARVWLWCDTEDGMITEEYMNGKCTYNSRG